MSKLLMGFCALVTIFVLPKMPSADVLEQTCSHPSDTFSELSERSLMQFKRTYKLHEESDPRTNQIGLPSFDSENTRYTCAGCASSSGIGNTAELSETGFNAVRRECCTPEMADFIRRMIAKGGAGMGVCASGGLFGTAIFFDCTDDNVDNNFDKLTSLVTGPGAPGAGGDCPWIGKPTQPNGCPAMKDSCPSFPDATVPPCAPTQPPTTRAPTTPAPTPAPTPPPAGECKWPQTALKYSLITKGFAKISAHLVYSGVVVGAGLHDKTPLESGVIGSNSPGKSYINWKSSPNEWIFKGGLETGLKLSDMFTWSDFEWLANNLKTEKDLSTPTENGFRIKVFNQGGTYNMYDSNGATQGYDRGKSLMVFTTTDDITLTKTHDGRQFGPTVLAPFAKVFLKGNAGFIDGCVIAKEFDSAGGQLQMHGDCYKGPLNCE